MSKLDGQARQVIMTAAASRVTGTPEQAALQMRAAVQVADGQHAPFVVWPEGMSREEKAAWLSREIALEQEREDRYQAILKVALGGDPADRGTVCHLPIDE